MKSQAETTLEAVEEIAGMDGESIRVNRQGECCMSKPYDDRISIHRLITDHILDTQRGLIVESVEITPDVAKLLEEEHAATCSTPWQVWKTWCDVPVIWGAPKLLLRTRPKPREPIPAYRMDFMPFEPRFMFEERRLGKTMLPGAFPVKLDLTPVEIALAPDVDLSCPPVAQDSPSKIVGDDGPGEEDGPWAKGFKQRFAGHYAGVPARNFQIQGTLVGYDPYRYIHIHEAGMVQDADLDAGLTDKGAWSSPADAYLATQNDGHAKVWMPEPETPASAVSQKSTAGDESSPLKKPNPELTARVAALGHPNVVILGPVTTVAEAADAVFAGYPIPLEPEYIDVIDPPRARPRPTQLGIPGCFDRKLREG